jgi:hypothetical protein
MLALWVFDGIGAMVVTCGPGSEDCADGYCRQEPAGNTIFSSREAAARCPWDVSGAT